VIRGLISAGRERCARNQISASGLATARRLFEGMREYCGQDARGPRSRVRSSWPLDGDLGFFEIRANIGAGECV
jgi:hypothetical protein